MSDVAASGPCSVELVFDAHTDARVRDEWQALADRSLSSLAAHPSPSNRPHITLVEGMPQAALGTLPLEPFDITLGPPILFGSGTRRVLARSVVPSRELLELRAGVLERSGATEQVPWTPHVTLARRLQLASLAQALELVTGEIDGVAVAVRSWNSETHELTVLSEPSPGRPPVSRR